MCTDLRLVRLQDLHVSGRTMDFAQELGSRVQVVPAGNAWSATATGTPVPALTWTNRGGHAAMDAFRVRLGGVRRAQRRRPLDRHAVAAGDGPADGAAGRRRRAGRRRHLTRLVDPGHVRHRAGRARRVRRRAGLERPGPAPLAGGPGDAGHGQAPARLRLPHAPRRARRARRRPGGGVPGRRAGVPRRPHRRADQLARRSTGTRPTCATT